MRSCPLCVLCVIAAALCAPAALAGPPAVIDLLPAGTARAGPAGEPEHFVGKKLFDYMDGGAEVFLAYGFEDLAVRQYRCKCPGGQELSVAIYTMGGPVDAYGIWSINARGKPVVGLGGPAVLARNMLSFFKGRYYVRVICQKPSEKADEVMRGLAQATAARIEGQSELPAELGLLPAGAVDGSARYLPNAECARTLWFDGEGDVLLSRGGKAFSATYTAGDSDLQCTRAVYPSAADALAACRALAAKLGLEPAGDAGACSAAGKTPDDAFAALRAEGSVLRWAGGAGDAQTAAAWLSKIE
ncbi:MAG: hypothetical protein JXR96_07470 [Deltaproteobacteria bacterium]|nr:hypothetical protein [Deltaproteobacteria bacterium]